MAKVAERVKPVDVARESLLDALDDLVKAAKGGTGNLPILSCVYIEARTGALTLIATNLDVALRVVVSASVSDPWKAAVSAKVLRDAVAGVAGDSLSLHFDDPTLIVSGGGFECRIATMPAKDFPAPPADPTEYIATLPSAALSRALVQIRCAFSSTDTRYFLNGAQLKLANGRIGIVATDGHRLVVTQSELASQVSREDLIQSRTVSALLALAKKADAAFEFGISKDHLFFHAAPRTVIQRRIEANFPAYERIIPKNNDKLATVRREEFASVLERIAPFTNARSKSLKCTFAAGAVRFAAQTYEGAEASASASIDARYDGPATEIALNVDYLRDIVKAVTAEDIAISFKEAMTQIVLTPSGDDGYLCVLMPMRV